MQRTLAIFLGLSLLLAGGSAPGLTQRVANVTLKMPATPGSAGGYSYLTTNAFPGLVFTNPIAFATPPGETNRLFVVERAGRIIVVTNLASPVRLPVPFLNISGRINAAGEGGLLGLAFHPEYAVNRDFYVFYTATGTGFSNRVARFRTTETNANVADASSELVLFGQYDEAANHNGGDVHFGPDGYLYVAVGDEGDANDSRNNSQTITKDFFSGILRLDVDTRPGSLPPNPHPSIVAPTNYAVPPDNPFVGATNFNGVSINPALVRTEFYAVGLRNPFRFSFDPLAGRLYCGDVGQNAWEEVDIITNGGNYGWAYREGNVAGPKATGLPSSIFTAPILVYAHGSATNQGNSITGGIVYRGDEYPELYGRYIFADYVSGNIWSLLYNGTAATQFVRLAIDANIAAIGRDPRNGDVLLCDLTENRVKRLVRANGPTNALPATLAQTGAFADLTALTPNDGIEAYDINVPFWSDNADKRRWFAVPDTNLTVAFSRQDNWGLPTGTVWIKHFELPFTNGAPFSARRLETRILVKNDTSSGGYGVTYRWGTSTTNAALVPDEGLDEPITVYDGGTIRTQVWHYPSRSECLVCHQVSAGFSLGFSTVQVNRERDYGAFAGNQIRILSDVGYFAAPVTNIYTLRPLAAATNLAWSLEYRVRSYLQANCSACHIPGGSAPSLFDARVFTPLSSAGLVDGPLNDTLGDPANRVVVPGDPGKSMLLARIAKRGAGQMPPLASSILDTQAINLVTEWTTGPLVSYESYNQWQDRHFTGREDPDASPSADPDRDGAVNYLEYLTGSNPTNELDLWRIAIDASGLYPAILFGQTANRGFELQWTTNLLEPDSWEPLDLPANAPAFRESAVQTAIEDPETTRPVKFYRVRVYEP